jgi:hypothetical protein
VITKPFSSHLGKAGHLATMGEFLYLGYNVSIPYVDTGDDIFVFDNRRQFYRVQVKTAEPAKTGSTRTGQYLISRVQLQTAEPVELYYSLGMRKPGGFDLVLISRAELEQKRYTFEKTAKTKAKTDNLNLTLTFENGTVSGWGQSFSECLNNFSRHFPTQTK